MTYYRVIPRDLFNEASLLKCLGKLAILLEKAGGRAARFEENEHAGASFAIEQSEDDGSISVTNLPLTIGGSTVRLFRPLNSRQPWPLYVEIGDETLAVFTDAGELAEEFATLIGG